MKSLMTVTLCTLAVCSMMGCSQKKTEAEAYYALEVKNMTSIDVKDRLVAIDLGELEAAVPNFNDSARLVMRNALGEELPYQKVTDPVTGNPLLIVPVDLKGNAIDTITIKEGHPILPQVYAEAWDLNAPIVRWSNDLNAYAFAVDNSAPYIYLGPSRTFPKEGEMAQATQSISANLMAIGRSLGFGDATFIDGNNLLFTGRKVTAIDVVENGPLRVKLHVKYAPVTISDRTVTEERTILCDVHSHFLEQYARYTFDGEPLLLALGVSATNSSTPQKVMDLQGVIAYAYKHNYAAVGAYSGIVYEKGFNTFLVLPDHLVGTTLVVSGEPVHFLTGNCTEGDGASSFDEWDKMVQEELTFRHNPLRVVRVRY